MIANVLGLLFRPNSQWQSIADKNNYPLFGTVLYPAIFALLPAIAWYYGTTTIGWTVGDGEVIKLTKDSATVLISLFYLTMVASICVIGYMIHWMSTTYGADSSTAKGIAIAGFATTPLLLGGAVGFIPYFWLALIVAVLGVCYSVYLLYIGIPIVMNISKERGFLFSSAVVAFCMVILIVIMTGSVILWDMGAAPVFTD